MQLRDRNQNRLRAAADDAELRLDVLVQVVAADATACASSILAGGIRHKPLEDVVWEPSASPGGARKEASVCPTTALNGSHT